MTRNATYVGELVHDLSAGGAQGTLKRIFRNSAYLEAKGGLILLMNGELRSPMTINAEGGEDLRELLSVGDRFDLSRSALTSGQYTLRLNGASIYRSGLRDGQSIDPIPVADIVKGATMLKLLYAVSDSALGFIEGKAFEAFAKTVLLSIANGRLEQAHRFENYLQLVGSGTGFTPAGDDFVAGFTASFNHAAGGIGAGVISLPISGLSGRTVPESATILDYAQRGYVDEGLERLILAAFSNKPEVFLGQLADLAKRGHTSGLDMSLGVLLSVAAILDHEKSAGALDSALRALRNS